MLPAEFSWKQSDWFGCTVLIVVWVADIWNTTFWLGEQVDAAQGAEEMVEQLTEKTLEQEERLQALEEEKKDLVSDWSIIIMYGFSLDGSRLLVNMYAMLERKWDSSGCICIIVCCGPW